MDTQIHRDQVEVLQRLTVIETQNGQILTHLEKQNGRVGRLEEKHAALNVKLAGILGAFAVVAWLIEVYL